MENKIQFSKPGMIEAGILFCLLLLSLHLASERIEHSFLPTADEGSWMSPAAEIARGNGFTTKWLEWHYLKPYEVPRPDDFRFPGLVLILGFAFYLFGITYKTGLITAAAIHLCYQALLYIVLRKHFGRSTALITLLVVVVSLLQLKWSTAVMTESLFGCGIAALFLWQKKYSDFSRLWWLGMGLLAGILFLIRLNGILFLIGPLVIILIQTIRKQAYFKKGLYLFVGFIIVSAPWMIRNIVHWGNPVHVAGNAGLMMEKSTESLSYTLGDYLSVHGIFFPIERIFKGFFEFFAVLHEYEHGLEVLPLLGVLVGIFSFKKVINSPTVVSIIITFIACCFVSYNSWAGVRFFSSIIPFVYGYGIYRIIHLAKKAGKSGALFHYSGISILALLLVAPVIYPHEYYQRKFAGPPEHSDRDYLEYQKFMQMELAADEYYYANELGQLNFILDRKCIRLEDKWGFYWVEKSMVKFPPSLVALTNEENASERGKKMLQLIKESGYSLQRIYKGKVGSVWKLIPVQGVSNVPE